MKKPSISAKILLLSTLCVVLSACVTHEKKLSADIDAKKIIDKAGPVVDRTKQVGIQKIEYDKIDADSRRFFVEKSTADDFGNLDPSSLDPSDKTMVSVNFDKVDIHYALELLGQLLDKNFVVGADVKGVIDLRLKDVPWQTALSAILNAKGLAFQSENGIIRIHERAALLAEDEFFQKRIEKFRAKKTLIDDVLPSHTEIFRIFYADLNELKTQILTVLGEMSGGAASKVVITANARQKSLIVKAPRDKMELIDKLISSMDKPVKQVLIEAFIVEAGSGFDKALGAQLGLDRRGTIKGTNYQISGMQQGRGVVQPGGLTISQTDDDLFNAGVAVTQSITGATSGIGILLGSTNQLKLALTALEADSISRTVSNPKVFTLDTVTASISQGREISYQSASGDGSGGTTTQFKEAALKLDVTPTVIGDGNVILEISLQKDNLGAPEGDGTRPINTMDLKTKLLVPDGAIVVIGGIYEDAASENDSKTPGLGDIPGIGRLFRSDVDANSKNELLIFISPNVI